MNERTYRSVAWRMGVVDENGVKMCRTCCGTGKACCRFSRISRWIYLIMPCPYCYKEKHRAECLRLNIAVEIVGEYRSDSPDSSTLQDYVPRPGQVRRSPLFSGHESVQLEPSTESTTEEEL